MQKPFSLNESNGIIHVHMTDWNPKMVFKRFLLLVVAPALLAGCAYFQFPGVHKVEVEQGNIITRDMVSQLEMGMTKSQVRYVMGTPMIADSFHQDRWDYFYSTKIGRDLKERQGVVVYFENDQLVRIVDDLEELPDADDEE